MPNGQPDEGEAPVIVSVADAAMHMFNATIEGLPEPNDADFPARAAVVLTGLRKLQTALTEAASRSRVTPAVIVSLSGVRNTYDDLMVRAARGPGATLGQRLYLARRDARLSLEETANGAGLRAGLIAAVEAEEPANGDDAARIEKLISALGRPSAARSSSVDGFAHATGLGPSASSPRNNSVFPPASIGAPPA